MKPSISAAFPTSLETSDRPFGVFNVFFDPYTYSALLYMLISLFTGIFYFIWIVTGLALSLGLFILVIGIPFFLLFIGSVRSLAVTEAGLVEGFLGVRMPHRLPPQTAATATIGTRIKEALLDVRTWSSILYLGLMLPLGCIYFTIAIIVIVVPISVTGASIYGLVTRDVSVIQFGGQLTWLNDLVHTPPGLMAFAILGLLLAFVMFHVVHGIGRLHGRLAATLLVEP